jgi:hypothetical protein
MEGIRIFLESHNVYPTVSRVRFMSDFHGTFPKFFWSLKCIQSFAQNGEVVEMVRPLHL